MFGIKHISHKKLGTKKNPLNWLTDKELVYFLINQSTHTASAVYSRALLLVSRDPFVQSSKEIHKDEIRKKVDQGYWCAGHTPGSPLPGPDGSLSWIERQAESC